MLSSSSPLNLITRPCPSFLTSYVYLPQSFTHRFCCTDCLPRRNHPRLRHFCLLPPSVPSIISTNSISLPEPSPYPSSPPIRPFHILPSSSPHNHYRYSNNHQAKGVALAQSLPRESIQPDRVDLKVQGPRVVPDRVNGVGFR